uniref:WW domain-containing protein n=1 Tax=Parastrongyloides trichosuri TaxID=131310 RepID=A0A0N5A6P1_PARTI
MENNSSQSIVNDNKPTSIDEEDTHTLDMELQESNDSLIDVITTMEHNSSKQDVENKGSDKIVKHFITNCVSTRTQGLPEGWKAIAHDSGHMLYLNLATRIATYSKPFDLKEGSARHHHTPLSSIPCLEQKKHMERVNQNQETLVKDETISPEELIKYSKQIYDYETKFFDKIDRSIPKGLRKRKFIDSLHSNKEKVEIVPAHQPTKPPEDFPSNDQLIDIECPGMNGKKDKVVKFNPIGKSSTNILHEYVQRSMKTKVYYVEEKMEFDIDTFRCNGYIVINELVQKNLIDNKKVVSKVGKIEKINKEDEIHLFIGSGKGKSKKEAKLKAGVNCVKLFHEDLTFDESGVCNAIGGKKVDNDDIIEFFKSVDIDNENLADLCEKSGQLLPGKILQIAIKKHPSYGVRELSTAHRTMDNGNYLFTLKFGNILIEHECKNKKNGKHVAAQKFLKCLHPDLKTWGEIIEIYGTKLQASKDSKSSTQDDIIKLATKFLEENRIRSKHSCEPNYEVLNALKEHHKKFFENYKEELVEQHINDYKKPILHPDIAAKVSRKKELENPTPLWKNAL